jgi:CRISPR-associated endonuclease Csn1
MSQKMRYRLSLDLGSTSLGWAMIRLDRAHAPIAVIKAGVRIFSNSRDNKGASLAVTRREKRAMRRRRDRLLKRKARMMRTLIAHNFFPASEADRKKLEPLNPYELRAKGLDEALTPAEFGRALFHINQRRGFKSNRKTDKKENDSGALKAAIAALRSQLGDQNRTVGEWLNNRLKADKTVRARYRQKRVPKEGGKDSIHKSYDLYIDRKMIEDEFDHLWAKQAELNPSLFNEVARAELKDCLLFQRPLKPVKPGRCTLLPDEERAPLALPSQQRFRILQEVNNLRLLDEHLAEKMLTLEQRNTLVDALERNGKSSFTALKKLLGLRGSTQFNLEDVKREELKGNQTSATLSKPTLFGEQWFEFSEDLQDEIVMRLVAEENEATLVRWLMNSTGIDEARAEEVAGTSLAEGYGSLSLAALRRILPALRSDVITYDKAVKLAGFEHHSALRPNVEISGRTTAREQLDIETGEIKTFHVWNELPYYGEALQRHVGFGTGVPTDSIEKRFGKIANPTVHIGLNQVRTVVNALIAKYGHPEEVIVEVARDLKQSRDQREEETKRQAENQKRNARLRKEIAEVLNISEENVKANDLQKMILWEELSSDVADRRCPYSGVQISKTMVLSNQIEIEHILPFSQTLDDSLNNKTVATVQANRIKGNRTPWEARDDFDAAGWSYEGIEHRAERMPRAKRYRFAVDGYQKWLREDKGFLARALNDTRYLSRVAREYVSLICPQATRVIPGQMTAILRAKFGLNDILGLQGEKNRNDHRHHAVDACVIGVTDQGLLQRFAQASASARERTLGKLVDRMPDPWPNYREHVRRAVERIWVSHKPEHDYAGEMFDATIYSSGGYSRSAAKTRSVIPFSARPSHAGAVARHVSREGNPVPYKGLLSNSNYCLEVVRAQAGAWLGEVVPTYIAYQVVARAKDPQAWCLSLRNPNRAVSGNDLVMRLMIGDAVRLLLKGQLLTLRVMKINSSGSITMVKLNEANISARYAAKLAAQKLKANGQKYDVAALEDNFFQQAFSASSLKSCSARRVTVSPSGEINDPGFRE